MSILSAPTLEKTTNQVAQHLPEGRAWDKKNIPDTNIRKLITGIASGYNTIQQLIEELSIEFNINKTQSLLEDWEKSVGIPDECIFTSTDIDTRRERVIRRLRKIPIVNLSELQEYVDAFFPDDNIELIPGSEIYGFEYDFEAEFLGVHNEKFIIVANIPVTGEGFEYDFEIDFEGGPDTTLFDCLINRVIPSNVLIIKKFVG